jgi:DNA-binding response OmpR family regulator
MADTRSRGGTTRLRVMVVDDEAMALATIERYISHWGWEAVPFGSFEHARAFLLKNTPDALVVDVRLGEFNGLQLVHLAKQQDPDRPVVAVSGFDDPVLRADAEGVGAAYLVKPLDFLKLKEILSRPVDRKSTV